MVDEAVTPCGFSAAPGLLTLVPEASFIEAGGWAIGVVVAGGKGSDVTGGGCSRAGGLGSTGGAPPSEVPAPVVPVPVVLDPVLLEPAEPDVDEEDVVVVDDDEPVADAVLASPFPPPPPPPQPPNSAAMASPISVFLLTFISRPRPVCRRIGAQCTCIRLDGCVS